MKRRVKIVCALLVSIFLLTGCSPKNPPFTIMMTDGLRIKMVKMITGNEVEALLRANPRNQVSIPNQQEFLLLKLSITNTSDKAIPCPYLFFLQADTRTEPPKTVQIYYKEEYELTNEGPWKQLERLTRIPPQETREGSICFTVPKNIVLKRFYVYQSYCTFPDGFLPSDIK